MGFLHDLVIDAATGTSSLGFGENVSSADIRRELFEGDDVRTTGDDSPRTARKKMIEYYSKLDAEKKENDETKENDE